MGEEAEARFRESLRAHETASARFGLGLLLKERGDRAGAEAEYRRAAALDPDYADAWLNLGGLLFLRGADGEAAAAYGQYLDRAPKEGAEETVLRVEALLRVLEERRKGAAPKEVPR
jgi:Flp pilus assembly protein TadD